MKKNEEKLNKSQSKTRGKRKERKQKSINPALLTPEQQAFLEKEEKIDKINDRMNKPIIGFSYICAFIVIGMMAYIVHFMVADSDEVIANSANPRLDSYAENVNRGDIKTSDGKVVASGDTDNRNYPYDNLFALVVGYS